MLVLLVSISDNVCSILEINSRVLLMKVGSQPVILYHFHFYHLSSSFRLGKASYEAR